MPLFLLPLLSGLGSAVNWLFTSPVGRCVLVIVAGLLALVAWTEHVKHQAVAAEVAKEKAAAAAEHQRREDVLAWAAKWADGAVVNVNKLKDQNDVLRQRIATASARNDNLPCLDADAVGRLREFGRPQTGH